METLKEFLMAVVMFMTTLFGGGDGVVVDDPRGEPAPSFDTAIVRTVVDGDTILVASGNREEYVRLIGIDAPEQVGEGEEPECYATESTGRATTLMLTKEVRLEKDVEERDKYGRLLRYVYVDGVSVEEEMLRGGYVRTLSIPPNTKYKERFKEAEGFAQASDRGLWGACEMLKEGNREV